MCADAPEGAHSSVLRALSTLSATMRTEIASAGTLGVMRADSSRIKALRHVEG